jgi:para-nitrobenzyl esterase
MESILDIRPGKVRGRLTDGVHVFKGIPYAAPPFGPHRLRPPQPVEAWSGVRDALAWGAKPPQMPYPSPWDVLIPERDVPSEECLTLNVWSPDLGSTRLPVMVWITGGEFEHGTAAMDIYDGSRFAHDGVVLVSLNYRVGAEGFAYLEGGSANLGLLDQLAALHWVQDTIAAFGGDPRNVTVFGQSAGALSIGTLLSMPRAEGLFRRAVVQSGGGDYVLPVSDAQKVAGALAGRLGIEPTRDALAAVPVDRALQAQERLKADLMTNPEPERWGREVTVRMTPWAPMIDGDVVPARPIDRITAGAGGGIDLLAGANLDEFNFFLVPSGAIDSIPPEMPARVAATYGLPVKKTLAAYRAERPGAGPGELLAAIQGDWYFRIPTLRLADAHASGPAATYMYEFAWHSPQYDGLLGACHGLEIPFVFDTLDVDTEPLAGPAPPQHLADAMHAAWVAFATTGNPGWPAYDLDRRATMRYDTTSEVVDDPRAAVRGLWDGVR